MQAFGSSSKRKIIRFETTAERLGTSGENFELIMCFKRILKLVLLGIKPIFVFDGKTPELKKRTLMQRFRQKYKSEKNYKKLAQRMIMNKIENKPIRKSLRQSQMEEEEVNKSQTMEESQQTLGSQMTAQDEVEILQMLEEYENTIQDREFEEVVLV